MIVQFYLTILSLLIQYKLKIPIYQIIMKTKFKKSIGIATLITGAVCINIALDSCKKKTETPEEVIEEVVTLKSAKATIDQVDTVKISGTATFTQKNNDPVTLTLDITCPSRANKSVAAHFHMMPDCGGMMAANAGSHWNPTKSIHGKFGASTGFHLGDIGNINLDKDGHAVYTVETNAWNINGTDTSRNVIGRSMMIHGGVDDYTTQPTGNSGAKIGCGAIK